MKNCKKCNAQLANADQFCFACGEIITKDKRQLKLNMPTTIILACVFVLLSGFSIYQTVGRVNDKAELERLDMARVENEDYKVKIQVKDNEIQNLKNELTKLEFKYLFADERLAFYDENVALVEENDECYHRFVCKNLGSVVYVYAIDEAVNLGYAPCVLCH